MCGYIFQLNCSNGGVPKVSIQEGVLTLTGLMNDKQIHTRVHGGPERALCLYSLELIHQLQAEGHPISPGSIGENVTLAGVDWATLVPGSLLVFGKEVIVEISSYTVPCNTIAKSFMDGNFNRVSHSTNPRWARLYARVVRCGVLAVNQQVHVMRENCLYTDSPSLGLR